MVFFLDAALVWCLPRLLALAMCNGPPINSWIVWLVARFDIQKCRKWISFQIWEKKNIFFSFFWNENIVYCVVFWWVFDKFKEKLHFLWPHTYRCKERETRKGQSMRWCFGMNEDILYKRYFCTQLYLFINSSLESKVNACEPIDKKVFSNN